jgi:hypothetical protein
MNDEATDNDEVVTGKRQRDGWDKFELLARPLSGILAAGTIAILGLIGQNTLTAIAHQSESSRLFTELQVRREESESELRKDIFNQTLKLLLDDSTDKEASSEPSKQLLRLELLALNFGDSLSLAPLYAEMDRDFNYLQPPSADEAEDWYIQIRHYKKRLHSLAKRVADEQVAEVIQKGKTFAFDVPKGYGKTTGFEWPDDSVKNDLKDSPESSIDQEFINEMNAQMRQFVFDDIIYEVSMTLREFNSEEKELEVDLTIKQYSKESEQKESGAGDTISKKFTLDYYNFPMIDNTRLLNNKRFALVLEEYDYEKITIRGIIFPGQYSSVRDRPFVSDAIEDLKEQLN